MCHQKGYTQTIECIVTVKGADNATLFAPTGTPIANGRVEKGHVTFKIPDTLWGQNYTVKAGEKQGSVEMIPRGKRI